MSLIPPIPSDPTLLRQPDGTRFADIPVSFILIARYAGAPDTIMTWLVRAMAEREDAGLGLPPRELYLLAATAGISTDDFTLHTDLLIREGMLTRWPDGSIRVPWGAIYQASVLAAQKYRALVDTLRAHAAAEAHPTPTPTQEPLDLL